MKQSKQKWQLNMKKIILFDVDGVLLNWIDEFEANEHLLNSRYRDGKVREFNKSDNFSKLKPYEDALKTVRHFYDRGWNIQTISAYSVGEDSVKMRLKNLKDVFGNMLTTHFHINLFNSKYTALWHINVKYKDAILVYVDDYYDNFMEGKYAGIDETYLLNRPHNAKINEKNKIDMSDLMEMYK